MLLMNREPATTAPRATGLPRVAVCDDDRRVAQSLADALRLSGRVEVVGTAGDVRGALELVDRESPDVVLLDPRLPDSDAGAALVASLARSRPGMRIVITGWAARPDESSVFASDACRYVSKTASPEEFIAALVAACSEGPAVDEPPAA